MKRMPVWQRLNTSLLILTVLLIVSAGLTFWVERVRAKAVHRTDRLESDANLMRLGFAQMGNSLRGVLLDPRTETELRQDSDAETNLVNVAIRDMQSLFSGEADLMDSLRNLGDFGAMCEAFETRLAQLQQ